MTAPIIALTGKKASEEAGKALDGDIYTRRWTTKKRGKKPEVEHELRVNSGSLLLGAVAASVAAAGAGIGLWFMQRKLTTTTGKDLIRIAVRTDATYKTSEETVEGFPVLKWIDGKLQWTTITVPAGSTVIDEPTYWTVYTASGIRLWKVERLSMEPDYRWCLSKREVSGGYRFSEIVRSENVDGGERLFVKFHTDTKTRLSTEPREGFTGVNIEGGVF